MARKSNYVLEQEGVQKLEELQVTLKEKGVELECFERSTVWNNVSKSHPDTMIKQFYLLNKDKTHATGIHYFSSRGGENFYQFANNAFVSHFPTVKYYNPFTKEYDEEQSTPKESKPLSDMKPQHFGYKNSMEEGQEMSHQLALILDEYPSSNGHGLTDLNDVINVCVKFANS
jgi:hypothetical protein